MLNKFHFGMILILMLALSLLSPQGGTALQSPRITILSLGEGSVITSPINLSAEIHPDPCGLIRVTLTSRNGDLLARQLLVLDADKGTAPILFETNLAFEIPSDSTEALLTLAIQDFAYRTISLRAVLVSLTSDGEAALQPMLTKNPWLIIEQPHPSNTIDGGQVLITGSVMPVSDNPIIFEMIDDTSRVIGSSQLSVETPDHILNFEVPLYYTYITKLTDVRLVVQQRIYPYNEIAILDSLQLSVTP